MISTLFEKTLDGNPRKYCFCDTPELIENYDLAIADKENTWICHHKLEAFFTSKELQVMNRYYHVSPRDLVFVENETEHHKWPHKGHKRSEECKQKIREANLGKKQSKETIEKRAKKLKGKCGKYERTDEWKNNLSKAKKGKKLKLSEERRKELSQRASERNKLYGHF